MPTFDGTIPPHDGLEFKGWDPEVVPVDGDATYTAKYKAPEPTLLLLGKTGMVQLWQLVSFMERKLRFIPDQLQLRNQMITMIICLLDGRQSRTSQLYPDIYGSIYRNKENLYCNLGTST